MPDRGLTFPFSLSYFPSVPPFLPACCAVLQPVTNTAGGVKKWSNPVIKITVSRDTPVMINCEKTALLQPDGIIYYIATWKGNGPIPDDGLVDDDDIIDRCDYAIAASVNGNVNLVAKDGPFYLVVCRQHAGAKGEGALTVIVDSEHQLRCQVVNGECV